MSRLAFAIDLIFASKTTPRVAYRNKFDAQLGGWRSEPYEVQTVARQRRYYSDRESFEKDLVFLDRQSWPDPKTGWKNVRYVTVIPVDPADGVVWC